jgi:leader peptidase (prepilin peptidase)/N-methyltransferase
VVGVTAVDWVGFAALVLVSLAFGSFAATLALRLPAGEAIGGRSHCRSCGVPLAPRDLVPLASWLMTRGRCRRCGAALGLYYPAVELAALALALWAWNVAGGGLLWASCGLAWTLLVLALVDLEHELLPDVLTLPLAAAGLIVAWLAQDRAILDNVAGAVGGFALFAAVAALYRRGRGREGLGLGDAKLLGALGAWVGATGLPSVIFIAALAALVLALAQGAMRRSLAFETRVPFGPALALAGWIVWLYGPLGF